MKCNIIGRTALAAATSLAIGLGITACSRDYTVAYVYTVSAASGSVAGFAVDYQSGVLTQLSGSPYASQLGNPTTLVAAPNGKFLYVIGGSQNAEVEEFGIGTDGKLYGTNTYNLAANGTVPTAAAIDTTGTYLYVTYTYQNGFTPAHPGPGGVTIFPINADNSLGTPSNLNVGNNPVAVGVAAPTNGQTFAYVVDAETTLAAPTVLGYKQGTNGTLTPLSGTTFNTSLNTYQGARAGVTPSAIAIDPTGKFVYVTDKTSNNIIGYQIATTTTGNLTPILSSPYATGLYPVGITIDPRGKYLYTANFNSQTVSSFSISLADGSLGGTSGAGNFSAQAGTSCVTIEPALGIYLFTSNFRDNSLSAGQLSPNTGQLNQVEGGLPYNTITQPACAVAVPNGSHAVQLVNQ